MLTAQRRSARVADQIHADGGASRRHLPRGDAMHTHRPPLPGRHHCTRSHNRRQTCWARAQVLQARAAGHDAAHADLCCTLREPMCAWRAPVAPVGSSARLAAAACCRRCWRGSLKALQLLYKGLLIGSDSPLYILTLAIALGLRVASAPAAYNVAVCVSQLHGMREQAQCRQEGRRRKQRLRWMGTRGFRADTWSSPLSTPRATNS